MTKTSTKRKTENIQAMFNNIAPTYDIINHILSFGLDLAWRRKAIKLLDLNKESRILDIAAGSGDIAIAIAKHKPKLIVAADFASNMFIEIQKKINNKKFRNIITYAACDAHRLPFQDQSFDSTIVAFGIRNFDDKLLSLREMHRVLRSGGSSVVLELTEPTNPIVRQIYKFHSRLIVPLLGKLISKHNTAYQYLPESIAIFPDNEKFLSIMRQAGFIHPKIMPLTFGTATIFIGKKDQRVNNATDSI